MVEVLLLVITLVAASGLGMAIVAAERIPIDTTRGARCRAQDGRTDGDTPRAPLLASDRDRERAVHAIGTAMAEGRLTLEEGVVRIEAAVCARRRAELVALLADLPSVGR